MTISKKQNIKISTLIAIITLIVSMVVHFFYTPFLLYHVGDDNYGLYTFSTSIVSWFAVAINAVISAYNKFAAEQIEKNKDEGEKNINSLYAIITIVWAMILFIVFAVIISLLSTGIINLNNYTFEEQKLISILLIVIAFQMIFSIITKVSNLNITFHNRHIWIKASTFLITLLTPLIAIPFLLNGYGIITIAIITAVLNIVANICDVLYDRFVLKQKIRLNLSQEVKKLFKMVFVFCGVLIINEFFYELSLTVDVMVLGFEGLDASITLYTLAMSLVTIARTCVNMIYIPLIPTVYQNHSAGLHKDNEKLYYLISFGQFFIWMLITCGFIACGKQFVELWLGEDRIMVFYICCCLFGIYSVPSSLSSTKDLLYASGRNKAWMFVSVGTATANFILTALMVHFLDKSFCLWACVISTAITSFLGWWVAINIESKVFLNIKFVKQIKNMLLIIATTAISLGATLLIKKHLYLNIFDRNIYIMLSSGITFLMFAFGLSVLLIKKQLKEIVLEIKEK